MTAINARRNIVIGLSLLALFLAIVIIGRDTGNSDNSSTVQPTARPTLQPSGSPQLEAKVLFSIEPGWYEQGQPIGLKVDATQSSFMVRYTLDGTEPTMESALFSNKIDLTSDVVIRARAYSDDGSAGPETIGMFGVGVKPTLPVYSIVANPQQLWSDEEGIYVLGKNGNPSPPYKGANFWGNREIPVNVQYFDEAGKIAYESGAGMELFGGESRMQPQKSLELLAKKRYGAKRFDYRFFDSLKRKTFNNLILRNGGQDFPLTHMRDSLSSLLAEPILSDVQSYRPVIVYLNGQYWGIHDLREKMDESLISARSGFSKKSIDLLESDGVVKAGDDRAFLELMKVLESDESTEDTIANLISRIDVTSLFDYMIFEAYIGNTDWPDHNIRYWRSEEGDGKWRWLLYDADLSFGQADEPTLTRLMSSKLSRHPSVKVLQVLLLDEQMREQFLRRCGEILNGPLGKDKVISEIKALQKKLEPEMGRHQTRWNGTLQGWEAEVNKLVAFADRRGDAMSLQIKKLFQLSDEEMKAYGFATNHAGKGDE
ncbi:CotH kinase family protein [Cohnella mopanensis]|uniref:CotH kinase family protein n=1 Tax=Cohnella mopanensis TaxID=2911966 RepID=UPI001EF86C8E|nr:CotH kinase family protein [Cohnella mopanensis]